MIEKLRRPIVFKLFLLQRLPLAFFSGLKLVLLEPEKTVTYMPYSWMTKNPFKSLYFAAHGIAAEFSTGILAALVLEQSGVNAAMLIVNMRAEFFQKASTGVTFTCEEGENFSAGLKRCIEMGEPVQIDARSIGRDREGNIVSDFFFTWSFKVR